MPEPQRPSPTDPQDAGLRTATVPGMARSGGRDWTLDNAETLHAQHPRSFFIPSAERRRELRSDDFVQLIFLVLGDKPGAPGGERMWLTNISRLDQGRYIGTLTNKPAAIQDLAIGEEIEFGPEHVISVQDLDAIPRHWVAFAARRLVQDETLVPRYVYQDPADLNRPPTRDGRRASGWGLLVGDETEDQLNDASQVVTPSLGWLAERYPAFGALVGSGAQGREFVWSDEDQRYVDLGPYTDPDSDPPT
jgi:hypothetical protein